MKRLRLIALAMVASATLAGLIAAPAWATSARTFVSATGADTGPCVLAGPCATLNYALSKTSSGGEVVVLTSGSYAPVTITQSVTIGAAPGVYAGITSTSGAAVAVNGSTSAIVMVRGLSIHAGVGDGIDFNSGAALQVEKCVISGVAKGIYQAGAGNLSVNDTVITNGGSGVLLSNSGAHASLSDVRLESDNAGLNVQNGAASISNSVLSGNSFEGILTTGGEVNVESCLIANNLNGIDASGGIVRVSNSTITDNTDAGLDQNGGTIYSRVNNTVEGNNPNASGGAPTTFPPT